MYQNPFHDYEVNRLRTMQMLRDAQREGCAQHLLRQIRARNPRPAIYRPALARMGNLLVRWGEGLQQRYGALPALCIDQTESQAYS